MRMQFLGRPKVNIRKGTIYLVKMLFGGRVRYTLQNFPTATKANNYGERLVERYGRLIRADDELAARDIPPEVELQAEGS